MKKIISALALFLATSGYAFGAHALMESCDIQVDTYTPIGAVWELAAGQGVATCTDLIGDEYTYEFIVGTSSIGPQAALNCSISTSFKAVGPGFSLGQVIAVMGDMELGSMLLAKETVGVGVRVNPLGFSGDLTLEDSTYDGGCLGLGNLKGYVELGRPKLTHVEKKHHKKQQ